MVTVKPPHNGLTWFGPNLRLAQPCLLLKPKRMPPSFRELPYAGGLPGGVSRNQHRLHWRNHADLAARREIFPGGIFQGVGHEDRGTFRLVLRSRRLPE